MTDGEALLAAVTAAPDDDQPRLVYADWIEEHGRRERAEFIRLQIDITRNGFYSDGSSCVCAACGDKRKQVRSLWRRHAPEWFNDVPVRSISIPESGPLIGDTQTPSSVVRRGFVEEIVCTD